MTVETIHAQQDNTGKTSPAAAAEMLARLVDILIPGDADWP